MYDRVLRTNFGEGCGGTVSLAQAGLKPADDLELLVLGFHFLGAGIIGVCNHIWFPFRFIVTTVHINFRHSSNQYSFR